VNPSEISNEAFPPPKAQHSAFGPTQETACYALIFGLALLAIGLSACPWKGFWRSPSEIATSATNFVLSQGEEPAQYRLTRAIRYHSEGVWGEHRDSSAFALRPTFTHYLRLERPGWDTWLLELNRDGRIIRLFHDEEEGAMGVPLRREEARERVHHEASAILGLSLDGLELEAETLRTQLHRSEYLFEYRWPEVLGESRKLRLVLAGEHLNEAAIVEGESGVRNENWPWGNGGEFWRRFIGIFLIFIGAAGVLIRHRRPLAWRPALFWGALTFGLVLIERLLRVGSCEVAAVSDIYLAALIEAFQAACILGLVVATGEALAREQLPAVASLTRLAPTQRNWADAWLSAARAAVPCVLVILVIETLFSVWGRPVGFLRVAANELAYSLSAPVPLLMAAFQTLLHTIWHEGIFRFFVLVVLLALVRNRAAAVVISAIVAVLFGVSGALGWHHLLWLAWAAVAAGLVLRAGIRAAVLFHLLVLGGQTSLLLIWTGWPQAGWAGGILAGMMLMGLFSIGVWAENNRRLAS
jgi:hypothetical protein